VGASHIDLYSGCKVCTQVNMGSIYALFSFIIYNKAIINGRIQ